MDDIFENDLFDDDGFDDEILGDDDFDEALYGQENSIAFEQVIEHLIDEEHPFPPALWNHFSDMNKVELQQIRDNWEFVSVARKASLLQDLGGMMEYNFQVSFDDFAKFCLKDNEPSVREGAIRLLFEYERRDLITVMLDILENDADEFVQAAAASMLGNYIYLGELEEIPRKDKIEIEKKLMATFEESDATIVQRRTLEALSFSSLDEVIPMILAAYETGQKDWVVTALFAMGRNADQAWGPYIIRNLNHDDADIQFEAIQAAGEMYLEKALPYLLALVEEADSLDQPIRLALAETFKNIGGGEVIGALNTLLALAEDDEEIELIEGALEFVAFTNAVDLPTMFGFTGEEIDEALDEFSGHSHHHHHHDDENGDDED